jgi:hypothetical protein
MNKSHLTPISIVDFARRYDPLVELGFAVIVKGSYTLPSFH